MEKVTEDKRIPINNISEVQQILFQNISVSQKNPLNFDYKKDEKMTTEIFFPKESLYTKKHLAMDVYLISTSKEESFLEKTFKRYYENETFALLGLNLFVLDNFPKHKLGLIFLADKSK